MHFLRFVFFTIFEQKIAIWSKERKIDYVRAEHTLEERLVAPSPWATLSVHVVASPGSHGAPEVGGLTVHSFGERHTRGTRAHI